MVGGDKGFACNTTAAGDRYDASHTSRANIGRRKGGQGAAYNQVGLTVHLRRTLGLWVLPCESQSRLGGHISENSAMLKSPGTCTHIMIQGRR